MYVGIFIFIYRKCWEFAVISWTSQCLTKKLFLKNFAGQMPQLNWGFRALLTVERCRFFKCVSKKAFSAKAISHKLHLNKCLLKPLKTVNEDPWDSSEEYVEIVLSSSEFGSGWGIWWYVRPLVFWTCGVPIKNFKYIA